ncbi:2606_t:CDS:2, partial [Gigaspora rosea]
VTLIAPGDLLPSSEYPTINQISTSSSIESDATYQELYQKTFNRKQISGLRTPFIPYRSEVWYNCHVNESLINRFRCAIIEHIKSISKMLSSIEELNKLRSTLGIKPVHNPFERIKNSLVLANTFFALRLEYIQNEIIDSAIWYSPSLSFNEEPISSIQITFSN